MSKRIVIVGGVAAGASAATKARRTTENAQIVLIESGPYVSFANCGLPYYVGGEIKDRDALFAVSPKILQKRFNLDVRVNTRVESIDPQARKVAFHGPGGGVEDLGYDRLILATGSKAIRPPIPGLDREDLFTLRSVPDADAIAGLLARLLGRIQAPGGAGATPASAAPGVLVIGGGYIGLEAAEQLVRRGGRVTVVEAAGQLMPAMDAEMAQPIRSALEKAGVPAILSDGVARIADRGGRSVAVTRSGRELPFDLGILAVGIVPDVDLARAAGIELGQTGAIKVDRFQRTSDPAIYAAGDNCEAMHLVLGRPVNIPLAGPANKAGRAAGANAALDLEGAGDDDPRRLHLRGVLGTAVVRVCDVVAGVTGLTQTQARREGIAADVVYMPGASHAGYYPGAQGMLLKLLYAPKSLRLLGAQAVGGEGVDKRIDVLATAIAGGMTLQDLENLDLCYAPPFGSAKDVTIVAGFAGSNMARGIMPAVTPAELLAELAGDQPPVVIDVRTPAEYHSGHLDGAVNIPLDELRTRLGEVPADRGVAVHCAGGYRSYLATRILLNSGRSNVRNVLGGYALIKRFQALSG